MTELIETENGIDLDAKVEAPENGAQGFFSGVCLQYTATFLATLTILMSGNHMVWTSPSLPKLYAENSTIPTTIRDGSIMGSIALISNLPSSPIAAICADCFGRKIVLYLTPILYLIAWILIALAETVTPIIIAKIIVGFGDGTVHTVLPMYVGEIAEDYNRGTLGMFIVLMLDVGMLFTYAVGPWLSIRNMAFISMLFPIVSLGTFCFMPESPYYYLMKNQTHKARNALQLFRGNRNIDIEFTAMRENINNGIINDDSHWKDLFCSQHNLKPLLILIGLVSIQQFSGISAILIYLELIFDKAGGVVSGEYAPVLVGVVQLIIDLFAMSIVDKIGRRRLLYLSCFGCLLALGTLSLYFFLGDLGFIWVPIIALLVYIVAYSLGLGPIPIVQSSELFDTGIKAKGMAILDNYSDTTAFLMAMVYQPMSEELGYYVPFLFFAVVAFCGLIFVRFAVPETMGHSLEEIQRILRRGRFYER